MKSVDIDASGEKIKAWVYNDTAKEAIILCHGFSGSSNDLNSRIADNLSERYLVCRFDFRGSGQSDGDFYDTTITRELADLDFVVKYMRDNYDINKLTLVGHSFGGAIVLLYAADNGVDALVTLSGAGDLDKVVPIEFTDNQVKEIKGQGWTKVENWSHDGRMDKLGKGFYDDLFNYSTVDAAQKLEIPFLLIHGSKDTVVPHTASEEINQVAKHSMLLTFDTDHMYDFYKGYEMIDKITESLKSWLESHIS